MAEEKWEYPSLEWIHRVRADNYERTKHLPLDQAIKLLSADQFEALCREWGLRPGVPIRDAEAAV